MVRLMHATIEGQSRKCYTGADVSKAKRFISNLPHKMRVGLMAGLALIGVAAASAGAAVRESMITALTNQSPRLMLE